MSYSLPVLLLVLYMTNDFISIREQLLALRQESEESFLEPPTLGNMLHASEKDKSLDEIRLLSQKIDTLKDTYQNIYFDNQSLRQQIQELKGEVVQSNVYQRSMEQRLNAKESINVEKQILNLENKRKAIEAGVEVSAHLKWSFKMVAILTMSAAIVSLTVASSEKEHRAALFQASLGAFNMGAGAIVGLLASKSRQQI